MAPSDTTPSDTRYLASHEWARKDGDAVLVGITDVAVKHLSDLVFIDLPDSGTAVEQGQAFGEIESVKAVSELLSPVTGTIVAVNDGLVDNLGELADDPFGAGWMLRIEPNGDGGFESLLTAEAYEKVAAEE